MKTKNRLIHLPVLAGLLALSAGAIAQSYSIDWFKVSGGGGTSTGGTYQVSGTIGQPDASGAMTGLSEGKGLVLVLVTLQ